MKQKCEEIIIDQYLKGNITNDKKSEYLERIEVLNNPRFLNEGSRGLEAFYALTIKDPDVFFKTEQGIEEFFLTQEKKLKKELDEFVDYYKSPTFPCPKKMEALIKKGMAVIENTTDFKDAEELENFIKGSKKELRGVNFIIKD